MDFDDDFEDGPTLGHIERYQRLIDSGMAWRLEGAVGREAYGLIEAGLCILGPEGLRDFYGNYVPSRFEVKKGAKGSPEYASETMANMYMTGYRMGDIARVYGLSVQRVTSIVQRHPRNEKKKR